MSKAARAKTKPEPGAYYLVFLQPMTFESKANAEAIAERLQVFIKPVITQIGKPPKVRVIEIKAPEEDDEGKHG